MCSKQGVVSNTLGIETGDDQYPMNVIFFLIKFLYFKTRMEANKKPQSRQENKSISGTHQTAVSPIKQGGGSGQF